MNCGLKPNLQKPKRVHNRDGFAFYGCECSLHKNRQLSRIKFRDVKHPGPKRLRVSLWYVHSFYIEVAVVDFAAIQNKALPSDRCPQLETKHRCPKIVCKRLKDRVVAKPRFFLNAEPMAPFGDSFFFGTP